MKISKALKKIMVLFDLTMYRLAKVAELPHPTITRAVADPDRDMSISTLLRLADGLEKIDPLAKPILFELLKMPDDYYPELEGDFFRPIESPETIKQVIDTLIKLGYLDGDRIEKARQDWAKKNPTFDLPFELAISVEMGKETQ